MKKTNKIKVIIVSAITAGILTSLCATAYAARSIRKNNAPEKSISAHSNAVWAMQNCGNDIAKAEEISGLKYSFNEFSNYEIFAQSGLIEVRVQIGDNDYFTLRQSSEKGDITGIYEDYDYKAINDSRLSNSDALFAVKDGKVMAAYWSNGDCGYSISSENGLSMDDAINYIIGIGNNAQANAVWAMQSCGNDIAKAEEISGLKYGFNEFSNYEIFAQSGLIEVRVQIGDNDYFTLRQSSEKGDITGIYEDYDYKAINDSRLANSDALFAVKDGKVMAAYWSNGDCGYSISSENGLSVDDAISYIINK